MTTFTHLHVQSCYSLLESSVTLEGLAAAAVKAGMGSIALTDRNVMHATFAFAEVCEAYDLHPIFGLKLDLLTEDSGSVDETVVLLALSDSGYEQLMELSYLAQSGKTAGVTFHNAVPLMKDVVVILPYAESRAALEWKRGNEAAAADRLSLWQEYIASDCLRVEIPLITGKEAALNYENFTSRSGVTGVFGENIHWLDEAGRKARVLLEAVRRNRPVSELPRAFFQEEHGFFAYGTESMLQAESLFKETERIAARCKVARVEKQAPELPKLPQAEVEGSKAMLRRLCHQGVEHRYGEVTEDVQARLEHELFVIESMGYEDYFLIVWDIVMFAKKSGYFVGPGRGSAAGSLVAYVLYVTNVDPIARDLLFERFLNPERVTMPDIDIDFPDYAREAIFAYIRQTYGEARAAQIITFGTFGLRAAVRDAAKAIEAPSFAVHQLLDVTAGSQTLSVAAKQPELQTLREQTPEVEQLFKAAACIEGLPRNASVHAAGVIIARRDLSRRVPVQPNPQGEGLLTQHPMGDLEKQGLLKIDVLGLRNLTLIEQLVQMIRQTVSPSFSLKQIPFDDSFTLELLARGETLGIFQFESSGMQQVLQDLVPKQFEDLVAVNALYRPGPMSQIPVYIEGKEGTRTPSFPHPDTKAILAPTYGVMVYQEQVMQISKVMAGFSLAQADLLRRAVSKKDEKALQSYEASFIEGAKARGYDQASAEKVYQWIIEFGDYGFNRSHAVAYTMISYQLAYMKAHYPLMFYTCLLTSVMQNEDKVRETLREVKERGINVLPPSVQKSSNAFVIEKDSLRLPLTLVRHVGEKAAAAIARSRPGGGYASFPDVFIEAGTKTLAKEGWLQLIYSGAFDGFEKNRATLAASLERALDYAEFYQDIGTLFSEAENHIRYVEVDPLSRQEMLAGEREALGFYVSGHPLELYEAVLNVYTMTNLENIESSEAPPVRIAGLIEQVRLIRTKSGQPMAFFALTDGEREVDCVLFPEAYRKYREALTEQAPVLVTGRAEERRGQTQFIADRLEELDSLQNKLQQQLYIKIPPDCETPRHMHALRRKLHQHPGPVAVRLYYESTQTGIELSQTEWCSGENELLAAVEQVVGAGNAVLGAKKHST
ncbi:DNA polymerase III catalytic subunit DnaE type [Salsuginibacillus halophilus]|uniref:DNA polymerase III subunit alpha n=1 Tax=Salsuginibacillus halophilus TaxID=517424 RepID=A0A2P8HD81_9BACI|nr:DNA polymerase III subunit alpha [Salsuginibacillus halophilus]PSL44081.1 DNA polymerase III catalytic subunit DnaE type [Salsuginibacillus halophilus]